ncbi:kelch-like protein [Escherichia phage A4]|nr:kelch-like protein [Escherichia phage A4]
MLPFVRMFEFGNVGPLPGPNGGVRTQFTTSPVPSARNNFGYTYDAESNIAYIFGGIQNAVQTDNQLWSFNLTTRTWSQLANAPVSTFGSALCAYQGKIYLFGGSGNSSNNFYVYNISTNTWILNTNSIGKPSQLAYSKMITAGDKIYLWGSPTNNSLYSYTPSTNTWSSLGTSDGTNNNGGGDMCTDGTYIYITGQGTSTAQKYHIQSAVWSNIAPVGGNNPSKICYSTYDKNIYAVSYGALNLLRYDAEEDIWIPLAVNTTLSSSTGALFGSKNSAEIFYVLGFDNGTRVNTQYVFK